MGNTDPAPLGVGSLNGCLALSTEAGWNQVAEDWLLFFRHGTVFGVAGPEGEPVASGAVLPYDGGLAWISMVLVTKARRGQQLGTRILETCIAALRRRGLVPMLDATPAGERVYRPLGFRPLFGLTRWQGDGGGDAPHGPRVRPMTEGDEPTVYALDAGALGCERPFLLGSLFGRAAGRCFVAADRSGFVLARPGRVATQIGPLAAGDEETAGHLLDAALAATPGPVFLDLADRWEGLADRLRARGFTPQRPFLRMGLGGAGTPGDPRRLFVAAGPEFG